MFTGSAGARIVFYKIYANLQIYEKLTPIIFAYRFINHRVVQSLSYQEENQVLNDLLGLLMEESHFLFINRRMSVKLSVENVPVPVFIRNI